MKTFVGDTYYMIHDIYNVGLILSIGCQDCSSMWVCMYVSMCYTHTHTHIHIQRKKTASKYSFILAVLIVGQTSFTF